MSYGGNVRKRPDLWSYISFSNPTSRRPSVSLPTQNSNDPFEKPDRSSSRPRGYSNVDEAYSAQAQSRRTTYLKFGGIAFILLILIYFFSPQRYIYAPSFGQSKSSSASSTTQKCSQSYSRDKPLIQYALMIDAGSTGSRIHVYRFNNCGPTPELENEEFKMTAKMDGGSGLSSYDSDAEGAARSLDMLMDVAMQNVPDEYKSCSPVAVKATAGLRKLGPEKSERILQAVRQHLETDYPFPVVSDERGGVQVMDGTDEGVYAWITANYLLGKIGSPAKTPSAAVFDLGGGSTQIVFEPTFPKPLTGGVPEKLLDGEHKYEMKFGGRDFTLYQHSYLGYGLMAAREALHKEVAAAAYSNSPSDSSWTQGPVINPCIAPGMSRDVKVKMDSGETLSLNMTGPSTASPAQCRAVAEKILKKDALCNQAPCAFNGVHQPSLAKTFAQEDIYLFSYFYDRTQPLGMPESFTLRELKDLTAKVCGGEERWGDFSSVPGAREELAGRPEHCLDLNFMLALLHYGYEIPMEREVRIAKKIKGNELGWCLGASLPMLSKNSGWTCKN